MMLLFCMKFYQLSLQTVIFWRTLLGRKIVLFSPSAAKNPVSFPKYGMGLPIFPSAIDFYRPQRSCEGYIFTPVRHSVHGGGGLSQCMLGYHPPEPGTAPPDQAPPWDQAPSPGPSTTPRSRDGYCCGRYASYWNAFLLSIFFSSDTETSYITRQIPIASKS